MHKNVKILIIILISISILIGVYFGVINDTEKSYSVNQDTIDLFIKNNTELHVKESLLYSFKGTWNGIYRDIPLKPGESLENINVSADGAYSKYELLENPYDNEKNIKQIKVYLYSDSAKTEPITDKNVTLHIDYDFKNVISIDGKNGNLVYNLWGDLWELELGGLNASIHLNSKKDVNYTFNSQDYIKKTYWENTTLRIDTSRIPKYTYIQINMTFPLNNSITNNKNHSNFESSNVNNVNTDNNIFNNESNNNTILITSNEENEPVRIDFISLEQIFPENILENTNQQYKNNNHFNFFMNIWGIIVITTLIIPLATYIKYGNFSFNYKKKIETEAPTDDSPAIINSLLGKGSGKIVGEPNVEGYQATILDLINKKYLKIKLINTKEKNSSISNHDKKSQKKMVLIINRKLLDCHKTKLENYEKSMIKTLPAIERKGIIDFEKSKHILYKRSKAKSFQSNYLQWIEDIKLQNNEILNRYFNMRPITILVSYGIIAILLGLITVILSIFSSNNIFLTVGILMFIIGLLIEITPSKDLVGWTKEGKIFKSKWSTFKKYLKSQSMIKYLSQNPSKMNEYLAYAVALGIFKDIEKNFKSFPSELLNHIELYPYFKYPVHDSIKHYVKLGFLADTHHSPNRGKNSGNHNVYYGKDFGGGGGGGAGGGSGGGGGGAF